MSESSTVDWDGLRAAAIAASQRAYVPYSGYPVGAAALTSSGRVLAACNVENASYGLVLCAECGVVSALCAGSEPDGSGPTLELTMDRELLVALSCVNGRGEPIAPCGRCRQLLWEHAVPGMVLEVPGGERMPLTELLPRAFGPADLLAVRAHGADHE